MTKAQQIKKALAILAAGNGRWDNTVLEWFIREALSQINEHASSSARLDQAASAQTKAALRTLTNRLDAARTAAKQLPAHIREPFSEGIDDLLALAEAWRELPAGPKHRTSHKQQAAVIWAEFLLLLAGVSAKIKRGGAFHRLTAVLYGDEKADLYRHIRGAET
jgi:hypothetical protein